MSEKPQKKEINPNLQKLYTDTKQHFDIYKSAYNQACEDWEAYLKVVEEQQ